MSNPALLETPLPTVDAGAPPVISGAPPDLRRFDFIDALRGIAAAAVLFTHAGGAVPNLPRPLSAVAAQGARGVQLFYLLSAITLFYSLDRRKKSDPQPLVDFFVRRFFRIAPLFYAAMAFYLWRDGLGPRYWLGDAPRVTPGNIAATAAFLHGLHPRWINSIVPGGWSIAVEMMFYATVPFLYRTIRSLDRALAFTFVGVLASKALGYYMGRHCPISDRGLWADYLFLWLPAQAPVFLLGIAVFFLLFRQPARAASAADRNRRGQLMVAAAAFLVVALCFGTGYRLLPAHFLMAGAFALLIVGLSLWPAAVVVNPVTRYLGKISYSLYLTQFAVLPYAFRAAAFVMDKSARHPTPAARLVLLFLFGMLATAAVSTVTYHLIEGPGQNLGKSVINALRKRAAAARPAAV